MSDNYPSLNSFSESGNASKNHLEQSTSLSSFAQQAPSLGSLSQSARQKQLRQAMWILIGVGILTVLTNLAFFATIESDVDNLIKNELNSLHKQGIQEDPILLAAYRSRVIHIAQLLQGGGVVLGIVFVILGMMVYRYPVSCTILGLVLFIGGNAIFGYLDPQSLIRGWLVKIIVVVVLAKSISAAIAYKREETPQGADVTLSHV
jgi:hypothetical protein